MPDELSPSTLARLRQRAAEQHCTAEQLIANWLATEPTTSPLPYQQILNHTSDLIALFDHDLRHVYVNPAIERAMGLPLAQMVGYTNRELGMPAPMVDRWEAALRATLEMGEAQITTYAFPALRGTPYTYEAHIAPIKNEAGQITHLLSIMRDITQWVDAEYALRQNEAYLRSILETQTAYIIRTDLEGRYTYCNQAYRQAFDWLHEEGELIGQSSMQAVLPVDHEKTLAAVRECIHNGGRPVPIVLRKPRRHRPDLMWTKWEFVFIPDLGEVQCVGIDISEQKSAEEMLTDERQLFVNGPTVVFRWENALDWPIAYVSPNIMSQFGYDAAELMAKSTLYTTFIHPEDLALVREEVRITTQMGVGHFMQEYRLRHADGTYRWVYDYTTIVRDDVGKVKHYQGYVLDMTRQKEDRDRLRRSEARQHAMLSAIPDMMFRNHVDGTFLDYHANDKALLSLPPEQFLGQSTAAVLPPELGERHLRYIQHVVETGEPVHFSYQMDLPLGKRWFEAHMVRSGSDEALTIVRDVTQQRETQKQVQIHLLALQTAANGIIISDSEGTIEWVNPAFTVLTGYTPAEAIGQNPRDLVKSGHHPREFYAELWATIKAGKVWSGRVVNKRKDGTIYTEEQTITPVMDNLNRITHFIAIKQDATKQEAAEQMALERERLTASLKKEQEYNATIQHVIDTLAHDLRTPLTVIATTRDLLSHYFDRIDPAKRQEKLDTIGKQLTYVTELLNDLTLVAGSSLNHRDLQLRPVKLATLCQLMVEEMQESVGQQHVLQFVNEAGIETAVVDEVLINRILLNLLSNAIKYSPAGTEVRLTLGREEGWLTLSVTDHGSGISQEDLTRIFEPFYRVAAVRASHIPGTGLGLSIVQNCVQQHQGQIHVQSALGAGTTFVVKIPINLGEK